MLEVRDLHVKFHNRDREAVAGVSFTLKDGEILGLVGESGSGKSVTAMSIAGLLPRKNVITGATSLWTEKTCSMPKERFYARYRETRSASSSRSP